MKEHSYILTMCYFWSFVVLAVFIIFNMVLALIFTLYDEEYRDVKALNEKQKMVAAVDAEKRRRKRVADIKRRKMLRRRNTSVKARNASENIANGIGNDLVSNPDLYIL